MRAALANILRIKVWADQKRGQGAVLAITLGEASRASYLQCFFTLLLYVQAMLAARRSAIVSVLQQKHSHTCIHTQVPPMLLRQAIVASRETTAAESVEEAISHVCRGLGSKRHGGLPPTEEAQAVVLGFDFDGTSLR